ncbi:unnamed protein product [Musa acuminata subsp. malaccensis]|uniref:(wild Malaysian banana) hypothetical protein n=1 Tax=Musa acuminata subsp. malaccensis TaxID=214687 RepID=A0A804HVC2_MUSAM|nr:unnamed protein product [Musa acuminata subsp. malaccensis]
MINDNDVCITDIHSGHTSSTHYHANMPSKKQEAGKCANHLRWKPSSHLHRRHHHMERAREPETT